MGRDWQLGAHGFRLKSSVCIVETVAINSPIYMKRKHIGYHLSLHNAAYYWKKASLCVLPSCKCTACMPCLKHLEEGVGPSELKVP